MAIWTNEILDQLALDAAQDINKEINCLFHRFFLATTAGTSVYTLPDKVRGIIRITWRGLNVDPISWTDLLSMSPGTVFVDNSTKIETSQGTPRWYAMHPTNVHDFRFYPCPSVSMITTGDPYSPVVEDRCIISCWRHIDESSPLSSLPDYMERRTKKAYILWKAYGKEGKGQDLRASAFYKKKYKFLIEQFIKINSGAFIAKHYTLGNSPVELNRRPYKPILPTQFERN
jgi:hypothetical protein